MAKSDDKYDVFLSFGTPDQKMAQRLQSRLVDSGLRVFFYPETVDAGDQVLERIRQAIRNSRVALVCISDEAVGRDWITTEAALIDAAYEDPSCELCAILPVQLGSWTDHQLPRPIKSRDLSVCDLSESSTREGELDRIADLIRSKIDRDAEPLPAVLLAMSPFVQSGQFQPSPR